MAEIYRQSVLVNLCVYICLSFYPTHAYTLSPFKITDWKRCDTSDNAFLTLWDVSVGMCILECSKREKCQAVNFMLTRRKCELLRTALHDTIDNHKIPCVYIKMNDVKATQAVHTQCQSCSVGLVCELSSGRCVYKECEMFTVSNGSVKGNIQTIGSTLITVPHTGYILWSQSPRSVCQSDGIWDNMPGTGLCNDGWHYIPDTQSCYNAFSYTKTFDASKSHCLSFGAHLVQFETEAESNLVKAYLSSKYGVTSAVDWWIGVQWVDGRWVYTNSNTPLTFRNWANNEPNGFEAEPCVELKMTKSMWNDISCSRTERFICEKRPMVSLVSTIGSAVGSAVGFTLG